LTYRPKAFIIGTVAGKRRGAEPRTGTSLKHAKRAFDQVAALFALVALAPAFAIVALLIKLSSPGPVFFMQERTGKDGKPFLIYKFRTMVRDAPRLGPGITGAGDPRVTRVGRFLRVAKLDELPNLLNVVRGEMSLVGPRPDLPRFMSALTPAQRRILTFRPGLTGPTQIRYIAEEEYLSPVNIDEHYAENVFADKIASDLDYVSNWSLRRDFLLILYTPVALAFKVFNRFTRSFSARGDIGGASDKK
jgi:lipopolysaccharide/colanic/teichoic acid biosynthesis glycosyltransferase